MSMTKEQAIKEFNKDTDLRAGESQRLKPGALDEKYIDAYLDNPFKGKTEALRTAMSEAGLEGNATRQRAYDIHERLRDRIEVAMIKLASDARALGLNKLIALLDADSESIQAQVATTLTKSVFPDVQVTKQETIEDIDEAIRKAEEEISEGLH